MPDLIQVHLGKFNDDIIWESNLPSIFKFFLLAQERLEQQQEVDCIELERILPLTGLDSLETVQAIEKELIDMQVIVDGQVDYCYLVSIESEQN